MKARWIWLLIDEKGYEKPDFESLKSDLAAKIQKLAQSLNVIHWPARNEQHDQDHDIPDDEYAAIHARATEIALYVRAMS